PAASREDADETRPGWRSSFRLNATPLILVSRTGALSERNGHMATLKPLWLSLGDIAGRLQRSRMLNLATDYDGTLCPIVEHPAAAKMPQRARQVLDRMSQRDDVKVAIVSGGHLDDLEHDHRVR